MVNKKFSDLLHEAIVGDPDAVETVLARYMPLFNRQSMINGTLDEDLLQYILMRVVMMIPKFDFEIEV
jgi:hypothetical protein